MITVIGAVAVAVVGGAGGAFIAAFSSRRRTAGEMANEFAEAAATLVGPLGTQLAVLRERVAVVERENGNLTADNITLRRRIDLLEDQIRSLGEDPIPHDKETLQ